MLIGILSDTHNHAEKIVHALEIFRGAGTGLILHAGDITSPLMLDYFSGFRCRFVLGNGDDDAAALNSRSVALGLGEIRESAEFEEGGLRFFLLHGNNVRLFRQAVSSGSYDYIVKGHTHHFEDYVSYRSRIINPGSAAGDPSLAAILDTESGSLSKIIL